MLSAARNSSLQADTQIYFLMEFLNRLLFPLNELSIIGQMLSYVFQAEA